MLTTNLVDKTPNPLVNLDYKIPKTKFLPTNLKVPKVATEVATSVIQTGSSCGGYCKGQAKERVMQGGSGQNGIVTQAIYKKKNCQKELDGAIRELTL